jgi:aspartate carbamoyltransferase catalytic subunit
MKNTKHLISIDDLNKSEILHLISEAKNFLKDNSLKSDLLKNNLCFNVFFEDSTRTISSFFSAFSGLGGSVLNVNLETSSASKGETDFDTILNLSRLNPKFLAIRHDQNTFQHLCSKLESINKNSIIINAGDGTNEHPTQALGDFSLIFDYIEKTGKKLEDLKIVLFGDLKRNRVAHSHVKLFNLFGLNRKAHLVAPIEFNINYDGLYEGFNYHLSLSDDVIKDADILMGFRFKKEYCELNQDTNQLDLKNFYQLNHNNIVFAKKDAIVLHPGPVNRGVELSSELMDDQKFSRILDQVEFGLAMRKALISFLFDFNK